MNLEGYIKISRKLMNWEWYRDSNMVHVFLHLILKSNFSDAKFRGMPVKRGQFITSCGIIAAETGLTYDQVRGCLDKLVLTNEIIKQSRNKFIIITVCKYESYQSQQLDIFDSENTNNPKQNPKQTPSRNRSNTAKKALLPNNDTPSKNTYESLTQKEFQENSEKKTQAESQSQAQADPKQTPTIEEEERIIIKEKEIYKENSGPNIRFVGNDQPLNGNAALHAGYRYKKVELLKQPFMVDETKAVEKLKSISESIFSVHNIKPNYTVMLEHWKEFIEFQLDEKKTYNHEDDMELHFKRWLNTLYKKKVNQPFKDKKEFDPHHKIKL